MNPQPETPQSRETLLFEQKRPQISAQVRMVMLDGVPHFSAQDLAAAMQWSDTAIQAAHSLSHPPKGCRMVHEHAEGATGAYLSPVACWAWTHKVNPKEGQPVGAWTKRVAAQRCPNPRLGDPALFLTRDGDRMPPMPYQFSGRRSEWFALKYGPAYLVSRYGIHEAPRPSASSKGGSN